MVDKDIWASEGIGRSAVLDNVAKVMFVRPFKTAIGKDWMLCIFNKRGSEMDRSVWDSIDPISS